MKTFINIILSIAIWFIVSAMLLGFWVQSGEEITTMPFYYWIITLIVPYVIIYRYRLLDKFRNTKIPKVSTNKKNETPRKVDEKIFGVIGVIILIGGLYYYSDKIFINKVIFNDDLIGDYKCGGTFIGKCDELVKWKKNSNLFTGVALIYETNRWYEMEFYRGSKHGVHKEYKGDKLINECNIKYGEIHGLERVWYENGQLKAEINWKNGLWDGLIKDWYDNGQLHYELNFKDGDLDGLQKYWYKNGQLENEENIKNGYLDGLQKYWYENGQLESETNYKNGELDGLLRTWSENGQLKYQGNYKDGELVD